MHAILAISSLHLAQLEGSPPVESLKHYGLAIRQLRKAMASYKKNIVATLGTTLLLAYYEVMAQEHSRWTRHLLGARQLLLEVNGGATSHRMTNQQDTGLHYGQTGRGAGLANDFVDAFLGPDAVQKIEQKVLPDPAPGVSSDDENTLADLFWWFRKQDIYHAMIGGAPVL